MPQWSLFFPLKLCYQIVFGGKNLQDWVQLLQDAYRLVPEVLQQRPPLPTPWEALGNTLSFHIYLFYP